MEDSAGSGYRAYMLRMRRTGDAQPAWRASLVEVASGERYTFPSLDTMLAWLKEQTGECAAGQGPQRGSEGGHEVTSSRGTT